MGCVLSIVKILDRVITERYTLMNGYLSNRIHVYVVTCEMFSWSLSILRSFAECSFILSLVYMDAFLEALFKSNKS